MSLATERFAGQETPASGSHGRWSIRRALSVFSELLFPPVCQVCRCDLAANSAALPICDACQSQLVFRDPLCPRCAMPLPAGIRTGGSGCAVCNREKFRFASAMTLGVYGGLVRDVVIWSKQSANEPLTLAIGQLLGEKLSREQETQEGNGRPDLLAPVPMHWTRRLVRGVNGPELLCERLSARLNIPTELWLLRCRRKIKKQGTLMPAERRENVRGAYAVSAGYDIQGAHVLLVDDVMTTGATANEVSKMLRRAGAAKVSVAVIARGTGFGT